MHHWSPDSPHVLYKSDVAKAYRLLPVHLYWQIKQINHIGGSLHIDRNNTFGGCTSGCNWISFMLLVSWIEKKKQNIELLGTYLDDSFGPNHANNVAWYTPYHKFIPRNQVKLLELWDKLNIPHKEKKQIFGLSLMVIGIEVNVNALSMTMPADMLNELILAIQEFVSANRKFMLHEWQRPTGWINWSLNMFPLLRPTLNNFYAKISGKCSPDKYIRINNTMCADLLWAIQHLKSNPGVCLIHHLQWDISSADVIIYYHVCLDSMGFWLPEKCISYYPPVPESTTDEQIFYFEALCVLSAIHHATDFLHVPPSSRILIYTDNDNTIVIFNTLQCLPWYNPILIDAASISITSGIHLRVLHIPGDLNYVANVISCKKFLLAQQYIPGITISSFLPPQLLLGAPQKWSHLLCIPGNLWDNPGHTNTSSKSEQSPWDRPLTILLGRITAQLSIHIWTLLKYTTSPSIPPLKLSAFSQSTCPTTLNQTLLPPTFQAFANNLNHTSPTFTQPGILLLYTIHCRAVVGCMPFPHVVNVP